MEEILVCPNCGTNGEESVIEEMGIYVSGVDKYGDTKWTDAHPKNYYCNNCGSEFENLITEPEWIALQRDQKIKSVLE